MKYFAKTRAFNDIDIIAEPLLCRFVMKRAGVSLNCYVHTLVIVALFVKM
jgi:hypothetical protein